MGRPKKEKPNRADGRYEIKMVVGMNLDRSPIRKSFYSYISKADAQKQAEEYKLALEVAKHTGVGFVTKDIGFSDWSVTWLETYKKPNVKPSTYENSYCNPVMKHINPYFGFARMSDVTPVDIQRFYNSCCVGLSSSQQKKIKMCLNSIFELAIDNSLCLRNPCKNAIMPAPKEKAKKQTYTLEQAQSVMKFAKQHAFGLDIILLLELGLRRSELLGLMWSDLDIERKTLTICRGVTEQNNKTIVDTPKTANSIRELPLSTEFVEFIKNLQPPKDGYILSNAKGQPFCAQNWEKRRYKRFMKDLQSIHPEIPYLSPHELRHTCGTLLYKRTNNIYGVSKFLGHADIGITTKIYVHNDTDTLRESLNIK